MESLAVTLAAGFMTMLDVSIVNVALPSIQRGSGASAGTVQRVVYGYVLTLGLVLIAGGRLGDALGKRRMFPIALAGAAPTAGDARDRGIVAEMRGGLLTPQHTGFIRDLFRYAEGGRAFGLFAAMVGPPISYNT